MEYNFIQDITNQDIINFLDARNNNLSSHIVEIKSIDKKIIVSIKRDANTKFDCIFSAFSCRIAGLSYSKHWHKYMIEKYQNSPKLEEYIYGLNKYISRKKELLKYGLSH